MRIYIDVDKKSVALETLPVVPIAKATLGIRLFAKAHGFKTGNITTAPGEFWLWNAKTIKHFWNSELDKFEFPKEKNENIEREER